MTYWNRTLMVAAMVLLPFAGHAQGTDITFGGIKADTSLPVEVQADSLQVNQADGTAVFAGNVVVPQGEMRLTAGTVNVEYSKDKQAVARLFASGGVTLKSGPDAAESAEATYTIDSGDVVMTGNVLLTQGQAAISGQKLVLNLTTGNGRMEGRVTTTFIPAQD